MVEWLKMRASYRENISQLASTLKEDETDLSGEVRQSDILVYLHNQAIKEDLNRLRIAYEQLGLRLGEPVPDRWLIDLPEIDKRVFRLRFEKKMRYSEITHLVPLKADDVRHLFNQTLQRVMKKAGGE